MRRPLILAKKPGNEIQIVTLDPGGMSGESALWTETHWIMGFAKLLLGILRPFLRHVKKDAFNPPEVPAQDIADLFAKKDTGCEFRGKYFVLDDEVKSTSLSYDEEAQDEVWESIGTDLGIGTGV